jgi:Citrate synthase
VQRKLYPNVDFYSGIVQRAIGIPVNLFTGIFALARTVGWIAQLNEQMADPEYKIGRPRQLFTGSVARDVKPIASVNRTGCPCGSLALALQPACCKACGFCF